MEFTFNVPVVFITLKEFIGLVTVATKNRWTLSEDTKANAVFTKGEKELILSKGRYVSTGLHNGPDYIQNYDDLVIWMEDEEALVAVEPTTPDSEPEAKVIQFSDYHEQNLYRHLTKAQERYARDMNSERSKKEQDSKDWENILLHNMKQLEEVTN